MVDTTADSSPCRWAAIFDNRVEDSELNFVDLAPNESIARGQELLQMLWEPVSDPPVTPKLVQMPPVDVSDIKMRVRNTFVELVAPPSKRILKRSYSDSVLVCGPFEMISDQVGSHSDDVQPHMNKAEEYPRQKHVPDQRVLSLDTCISDGHWQDGASASTDTPRESVEEFVVQEACDATFLGEFTGEDAAEMYGFQTCYMGYGTQQADDSYHYLQVDAGSAFTQYQEDAGMCSDFCFPSTGVMVQPIEHGPEYAALIADSAANNEYQYLQLDHTCPLHEENQQVGYAGMPFDNFDLASAEIQFTPGAGSIWPTPWELGAPDVTTMQGECYNDY